MSKITTNMTIFKGCVLNQKNGQLIQVQAFLDEKIVKGLRCELLYTELLTAFVRDELSVQLSKGNGYRFEIQVVPHDMGDAFVVSYNHTDTKLLPKLDEMTVDLLLTRMVSCLGIMTLQVSYK